MRTVALWHHQLTIANVSSLVGASALTPFYISAVFLARCCCNCHPAINLPDCLPPLSYKQLQSFSGFRGHKHCRAPSRGYTIHSGKRSVELNKLAGLNATLLGSTPGRTDRSHAEDSAAPSATCTRLYADSARCQRAKHTLRRGSLPPFLLPFAPTTPT